MKMIQQLSESYDIPVLNAIRTDQVIGKAARLHRMVVDVDDKAKALEDYEAATSGMLELLGVTALAQPKPEQDENVASQ